MTQFINVRVDREVEAAYVRYRVLPEGTTARSKRQSEDVVVDYSDNGDLLGIELLALDDAALAQGRTFAAAHDLEFPRDLRGALIPA